MTPAAVAQPRNAEEVSQIVKFARDNGFQFTVKNGGHSFPGYSLNKGGIVLDMSAMKNVQLNKDSTEITIQGGCIWKDVYAKLDGDKTNIVVGCQNPSVGVSGFILGGGISPFSRSYGLGIDSVTEMTIVTASGDIVTVTDHETDSHKQNLFWALRGAGGGNFGVLVEFKTKVHKLRDASGTVVCGRLSWDLKESDSRFKAMMDTFNAMDCPSELTVDASWRENDGRVVGEMTVIYNGGEEECREAIAPILRFSPDSNTIKAMAWSDWVHEEEGFDHTSTIYHHHASFVLPQGSLDRELTECVATLMEESHERFTLTAKGESRFLFDHIGAETARVGAAETAFPWRSGAYVVRLKVQWNEPGSAEEMMEFVQKCKTALKPFSIQKTAAYLNYIDNTVSNWQQSYYGPNYGRLQQVKNQWDPTDVFHFDRSIELPRWSRTPVAW